MADRTDPHRHGTPPSVRVAVVTVSDTRTEDTDESGAHIREALGAAGHQVSSYALLPDEPEGVRAHVEAILDAGGADCIITTGGTGIAARDSTYEALASLFDKELPGFGELFRMLSFEEVGARAMLSRAAAGSVGKAVLVMLPGSRKAVELALKRLLLPELGHMVKLVRGPDTLLEPGHAV